MAFLRHLEEASGSQTLVLMGDFSHPQYLLQGQCNKAQATWGVSEVH